MQEDEFLWYKVQQKHYNVGDFVLSSIVVACVQTPPPPPTPHPLGKIICFFLRGGEVVHTL